MAARMQKMEFDNAASVLRTLGAVGGTTEDGEWLRNPANAGEVIAFIQERRNYAERDGAANPFALPVETLITRFREANEAQSWGFAEDVFTRLLDSAPAMPEGRSTFLSLRIRFDGLCADDGTQAGIERTANAHVAELIRVHGEQHVSPPCCIRTDAAHLRLRGGMHAPCVEWCVIGFDRYGKEPSIDPVHGNGFVADEGLAFAWLYPEFVRTIGHGRAPYLLGGYGLRYGNDQGFHRTLGIDRIAAMGRISLSAYHEERGFSGVTLPFLKG